jgi:integrase
MPSGSCQVASTGKVTREVFEHRVLVPLQREGRSTDLLRRVTKTMKAVLNRCAKRGIIAANPLAGYVCELIGSPGRKIERRAFSEAELQAIFAAAGPYRPLLMTAAFTGMRNGELFALQRGDVDLERGVIHVRHSLDHRAVDPETGRQGRLKATKTERSERIVAMPRELCEVLRAHLASHAHEFVFATRKGTPMRQDNVPRWWYALLDRAGVPRATFYSLRHSFASLAAASGVPSIAVAQAMGHANSDLVRRVYSHLMESSAREVAERVASRISQVPALRVVQGGRE